MTLEKTHRGKTYVTQYRHWGLYHRNGHRLLCEDGKIRAAELSQTGDTYFSVPARVRICGKWITGYMTVESADGLTTSDMVSCYTFRHHTCHDPAVQALPKADFLKAIALHGGDQPTGNN